MRLASIVKPSFFLERAADGAANRVMLPAGGCGDLLDRGALAGVAKEPVNTLRKFRDSDMLPPRSSASPGVPARTSGA
jgi:hypothetical protein